MQPENLQRETPCLVRHGNTGQCIQRPRPSPSTTEKIKHHSRKAGICASLCDYSLLNYNRIGQLLPPKRKKESGNKHLKSSQILNQCVDDPTLNHPIVSFPQSLNGGPPKTVSLKGGIPKWFIPTNPIHFTSIDSTRARLIPGRGGGAENRGPGEVQDLHRVIAHPPFPKRNQVLFSYRIESPL